MISFASAGLGRVFVRVSPPLKGSAIFSAFHPLRKTLPTTRTFLRSQTLSTGQNLNARLVAHESPTLNL